jgi:thiol-disulfide isomerase/thioredoxin
MKLPTLLVLATATVASAQTPPKNASAGKTPASAVAAPASAAHATLADLTKDLREKKLAALEAYVKTHGTAKDAPAALVEAVQIAEQLGRPTEAVRYADLYLKSFATGPAANQIQLSRAAALHDSGDAAGAQKAYEAIIDKAGDDLQLLVQTTTQFGEMLVADGKKDEAVELMNVVGAAHAKENGFQEYLANIAKPWALVGTEPKPLGKNDVAGKPLDFADYKGKVLLVDFWATWCGPCMQELPNVLAAYDKYHDKGFEILGISLDRDRAAFDKVVAERGMTWRHYYDGKFWENEIATEWGVRSIPATYLIGPDGKVAAVGLRGDALDKKLEKLLGMPKAAAAKPAAPAAPPKK